MTTGRVRRAYLGFAGQNRPLGRRRAQYFDLPNHGGVEVSSLEPEGPAGVAGLRENDIIVSVDGLPTNTIDDIHRLLNDWPIGRPLPLRLTRGRRLLTIEVTPVEMPD